MIYFRADSNSQIASGHIMRCITIASFFKKKGYDVEFLIADENPIQMLEKADMPYTVLNSQWDDLSVEVESVLNKLKLDNSSTLIIDTYQVNRTYVEALKPFAAIYYLGSKQEYLGALEGIINYSSDINYEFYNTQYNKSTKLLLGPSYAPLREEFCNVPEHYNIKDLRILLTSGNTNQNGCIEKILENLTTSAVFENINIDVVVGNMFTNKQELQDKFSRFENINLHYNVTSMADLMKNSSLSIAANGTTVYELAASNVPVISFAMVREQVPSAKGLQSLGVVDYAGTFFEKDTECLNHIQSSVEQCFSNRELLKTLGKKAHSVIDGKGCEKIYNSIAIK